MLERIASEQMPKKESAALGEMPGSGDYHGETAGHRQ